MVPDILKKGMKFRSKFRGNEVEIINIEGTVCTYSLGIDRTGFNLLSNVKARLIAAGYELIQDKPLDYAFKELDKKICSHRNIREDRYFSAMVYRTCKDCGQPLN